MLFRYVVDGAVPVVYPGAHFCFLAAFTSSVLLLYSLPLCLPLPLPLPLCLLSP